MLNIFHVLFTYVYIYIVFIDTYLHMAFKQSYISYISLVSADRRCFAIPGTNLAKGDDPISFLSKALEKSYCWNITTTWNSHGPK